MKLTFHQSATVTIENEDVKILCDPWLVDGAYYGSWMQYPSYDFDPEMFDDIDYIYISHIHPDHCNRATLSRLNKDIPILIHNFPEKFLKKNIESIGFKVIELPHNKRVHLKNNTYINISAADDCDPAICGKLFGCSFYQSKTTNSTNQIDTMCVVDNGNEVIVNTNDCPFELANHIVYKIKTIYQNIDLLLVGYSGASSYPHCYELPFEEKLIEAVKKKQRRLRSAINYINLFKPKYFLPFAGRYTLGGRLHTLNNYRGEPELEDAYDELIKMINQNKHRGILLNNDSWFDISTGNTSEKYQRINPENKQKYIKNILSNCKFDFDDDQLPTLGEIKKLLPLSYDNFEYHRKELGFSSDTVILIQISEDKFCAVSCDGSQYKIISKDELDYKKYIKLSMDLRLLYRILQGPRKAVWNNADIGAHIQFKRVPNVYERGLYYCLNYFHA